MFWYEQIAKFVTFGICDDSLNVTTSQEFFFMFQDYFRLTLCNEGQHHSII